MVIAKMGGMPFCLESTLSRPIMSPSWSSSDIYYIVRYLRGDRSLIAASKGKRHCQQTYENRNYRDKILMWSYVK